MGVPLACFLTWTCYGTWLPGDDRGSVDDQHNRFGGAIVEPDALSVHHAGLAMSEPAFKMGDEERRAVDAAIRQTCAIRRWAAHAVNVRTNHVHVVVAAAGVSPERAMGTLKSWATRALRTIDRHADRRRFWTNQGSNRWLWSDEQMRAAVVYTLNQ